MYNYKAKVLKVIDGDTVRLEIDLGFHVRWTSNCRMAKINTPELGNGGEAARDYVKQALPLGGEIEILSTGLDKYGRPIVEILQKNKTTLNQELLDKQLAKPY